MVSQVRHMFCHISKKCGQKRTILLAFSEQPNVNAALVFSTGVQLMYYST